MLKKFFLNTLSSFVGAWLALVLVVVSSMILLFGMIGSGIASEMGDAEQLKSKSILTINLDGAVSALKFFLGSVVQVRERSLVFVSCRVVVGGS